MVQAETVSDRNAKAEAELEAEQEQIRKARESLSVEIDAERAQAKKPGAELKKELDKSKPKGPLDWGSANKANEEPVPEDMQRIVDAVFIEDPWPIYQKLEKSLRVGEKRSDRGVTEAHLDEAETNARLAHRLWITAKVARDQWEAENQVVFGAMRAEATAQLQREKDQGTRSKQITDADVNMMCAAMFQDEWVSQESRRKKFEAMVENMKHLADVMTWHPHTVATMHGKQR